MWICQVQRLGNERLRRKKAENEASVNEVGLPKKCSN